MSQMDVCDNHTLMMELPRERHADPLLRLARAIDRMISAYATERERRHTNAMLRKLSDRELRDIGIDPAGLYGERVGTIGEVHGDRFHGC